MSTPRKHHYLPQFYLEGFKVEPQKGKKPHIWQIEKSGDQTYYSPAIEDTGCIRDFHTLDFTNEESDHKSIEALLSKLESEQSALVRAMRQTKRIEASQVEPLSAFISLMRYRIPTFADHVETYLRSVVLDAFKIMYHAGAFSSPPPDPHRVIVEDLDHRSEEERFYCIGRVNDGIMTVRFTYRGNVIRIFGAGYWRKGRKIYEKENKIH